MQITESAHRHGVSDADIQHAWRHMLRYVEVEYFGDSQMLIIGPDQTGRLLELIAVPAGQPTRVIHADLLRPKFYEHLR